MKQPKAWANLVHVFLYPIALENGAPLERLELRPFTVQEHRAALAKAGNDVDDRYEALLQLASGLESVDVEKIKRPDYVSLEAMIQEYISLPATFYQEIELENPDDVPLLIPIKGIGRTIETLQLDAPALKVTKAMRKLKTADDRADFCSAACTGLSVPELNRMSVPDWTQLQGRLNDFLNKPASFFQKTTST